ncbi:hypothetical protein U0070_007564 [Myodes glareolus]|uniref:Uncharacterized protein n=1 Tax=Myodes glareolus TaxID=447135 RepID=A0AAW0J1B3_MYOGA
MAKCLTIFMAQMDICGKKLAREGDPEASVQSQAIGDKSGKGRLLASHITAEDVINVIDKTFEVTNSPPLPSEVYYVRGHPKFLRNTHFAQKQTKKGLKKMLLNNVCAEAITTSRSLRSFSPRCQKIPTASPTHLLLPIIPNLTSGFKERSKDFCEKASLEDIEEVALATVMGTTKCVFGEDQELFYQNWG